MVRTMLSNEIKRQLRALRHQLDLEQQRERANRRTKKRRARRQRARQQASEQQTTLLLP